MVEKTDRRLLYEQVARIGKAISSPKRLEILSLLTQSSKTVETLAAEVGIDIKLASAHLRTLKETQLVSRERQGKYIFYRADGDDVAGLLVLLRQVAETHLQELRDVLAEMAEIPELSSVDRHRLLERAEKGEIIVIDVRPRHEYQSGHLPFARSLPLDELKAQLNQLPRDKEIVAYCRGPFCIMANQAVDFLSRHHYKISMIREGVNEWRAAGMPVEI